MSTDVVGFFAGIKLFFAVVMSVLQTTYTFQSRYVENDRWYISSDRNRQVLALHSYFFDRVGLRFFVVA